MPPHPPRVRHPPVYVDNFLSFPHGALVPDGYYDRLQGHWLPSDNGIVLGILDITSTNGISEAGLDLGAGFRLTRQGGAEQRDGDDGPRRLSV